MKEKRVDFICLFCPKEFLFNICVSSHCIVYWRNFQNVNTFIYQETSLTSYTFVAC